MQPNAGGANDTNLPPPLLIFSAYLAKQTAMVDGYYTVTVLRRLARHTRNVRLTVLLVAQWLGNGYSSWAGGLAALDRSIRW